MHVDPAVGDADGKGWYTDLATGKRYNGWYIATNFAEQYSLGIHPAEDWNGNGGGNTDLGQDVHAVANGKVVYAADAGRLWGNIVIIEHTFYENQERKEIRSLYAHLHEIKVRKGDDVARRQIIATVGQDPDKLYNAHLHLELRWDKSLTPTYWPSSNGKDQAWVREHYTSPTDFIKAHQTPKGLWRLEYAWALVLTKRVIHRCIKLCVSLIKYFFVRGSVQFMYSRIYG